MIREIPNRVLRLVTVLLLAGMLITPLGQASARKNFSPLADEIFVNPVSGLITTEAGGTASFTVVLTSQPSSAVTFGLSSSDSTEGTVSPTSVTLNPGNWYIEQTVIITGVNDLIVDGDVPFQIITAPAISNDPNYNGVDAADVSVTNQDDDTAGIIVTPVSGLITSEAGGTATFTVGLTSLPGADVTMGISSSDSTEGTVSTTSLTFTPGNWDVAQTVTVTGVDDLAIDGNIAYQIITAPATSSDLNYNGVDAADVSVTNLDDETAGFTVNPISGLLTTEVGGTASFTVTLNITPTADVTFGLSSSDTTEGTVSPTSMTFTPGNWNIAQTVTMSGVDDLVVDGDVAYQIITAPANSSDPDYNGVDAVDVSVTNQDDDIAGITVNPVLGLITSEAGGIVTFTVALTSQPVADVIIGLNSTDITEGLSSPISVTLTSGNWNVGQMVTVTGVDDLAVDGDVDFQIITSPSISSDLNYSGFDAADVSVTNQDDDIPGITVNPLSGLLTTEAGGIATFTIVLNRQPVADVTIGLSSSDVSEGTVSPASVTFTPSNWDIAQTVTVTGVDDFDQDGNSAYQIITAPTISSNPSYHGVDAADVSVINQDDDTAGITVNPMSDLLTTEAGGTDTFSVVLNTQPLADVTIGLSSSDTSEASVSPNQLTFTSSNWSSAQIVTVTGINDQLDDGDQAYTIITGVASSGDPAYDGWDAPDISGTNSNDDFTPVATADMYLTNASPSRPLIIAPPGVLGNDSDANNDSLIAIKVSDPLKGVLDLNIDGSFIYTPTQNYTQVETDSFSYTANDGILGSSQGTVEIVIDPIIPTVNWISPVTSGGIYETVDLSVQLQVEAFDNLSIQQVNFIRWDALIEEYVDIGVVSNSPYQLDLDTRTLNSGWNQIFVRAEDTAGNTSILPFIWIYRKLPPSIFLPLIAR